MSVFICMLLLSFCGWLGYAYFNPNTASGRFLIKVGSREIIILMINLLTFFLSVPTRGLEVETEWGPVHGGLNTHVRLSESTLSACQVPPSTNQPFLATRISPLYRLQLGWAELSVKLSEIFQFK